MKLIKIIIMMVVGGVYGAWLGSVGLHFPTTEYLIGIAFMGVFVMETSVLSALFGEDD